MNSVVQVNARIPLNEKTVKSQSLRNYISTNSTDPDFFPCSIILYSRDVCQKTAEKIRKMDEFSAITSISRSNPKRKKDVIVTDVGPLRMCIGKAVMDTSSFRNPLTIWERDHHLGRKAQAPVLLLLQLNSQLNLLWITYHIISYHIISHVSNSIQYNEMK